MLNLKLALQDVARRAGYIVKRSNYYSNETLRLVRYLEVNKIDTVLDVGGNKGDYALSLIEGGFTGKIYSFEALPTMHDRLVGLAKKYQDQWQIAPRCAISDGAGTAEFYVTKAISSSSLLQPNKIANGVGELFDVVEKLEVRTESLTAACEALGLTSGRMFLKLDIQGGEERALLGAQPLFPRITGIVAEMPLRIYYEGQAHMKALDDWITARDYLMWDIQSVWRDPDTGRLDHVDVTYFRAEQ